MEIKWIIHLLIRLQYRRVSEQEDSILLHVTFFLRKQISGRGRNHTQCYTFFFLFLMVHCLGMFIACVCILSTNSVQSCLTFCDPMDCSMPRLPVYHRLLVFTQTHAHGVGDAIQLSHPLSSPSPLVFNLFQHQGLFK